MIYNLVEAAQEFLSEIFPQRVPSELVKKLVSIDFNKSHQLSQKDSTVSSGTICSFDEAFVYSPVDLFSGSGESWHWNIGMDESSKTAPSHAFAGQKQGNLDLNKQVKKHMESVVTENNKPSTLHEHTINIGALEEDSEEETEITDSSTSELDEDGSTGNIKDIFVEGNLVKTEYDYLDNERSDTLCSEPVTRDHPTQIAERDLLMAHLLRIACAPKGPLSDSLPEITSELLDLGIVSEGVRDLAIKPSSSFDEIFDRVFRKHIVLSKNTPFWRAALHYGVQNPSTLSSRYLGDFEEIQPLACKATVAHEANEWVLKVLYSQNLCSFNILKII
ncbi:hypothetical protein F511_08633 [Dorcoceras hygrometricum]|uniref:Uncharacterized protein n=1 Tax=Dorcoceras hygrometricum TaxID=472368 RepID=A0A2Z7CIG6_9LAMI|nr:hypothetical protein F511_08633 [Dorcoceras hygrometricum]